MSKELHFNVYPRSYFISEETQGYGTSTGCAATNLAASIYFSPILADWFVCLEYTLEPTSRPLETKKRHVKSRCRLLRTAHESPSPHGEHFQCSKWGITTSSRF